MSSPTARSILALDPATKTGWAHSCGEFGVWNLGKELRPAVLYKFLTEFAWRHRFDAVAFEAPAHLKGNAIKVLNRLCGAVEVWCARNDIEPKEYSPSEIKKHATGKGNATKDEVAAAAVKRWTNVRDYDAADALWLLDLATSDLA